MSIPKAIAGTVFGALMVFRAGGNDLPGASNEFAGKLLGAIGGKVEDTFVLSPLSIFTAMGMVSEGAKGQTRAQLLEALSWPADSEIGTAVADYLSAAGKSMPEFSVANALIVTRDPERPGEMLESYKDTLDRQYGAEIFPGSLDDINSWVSRKTRGKIPRILEELSETTMCVIVNAAYFRGEWESPFSPDLTRVLPFTTGSGEEIQVPSMNLSGDFRSEETDSYRSILLPYSGGSAAMVVLVPRDSADIGALGRSLTGGFSTQILERLMRAERTEVALSLPKFGVESSFNLIPPLIKMGVQDAFSGLSADFSGMATIDLQISQVVHKARVEVDEAGTAAAASTTVEMIEVTGMAPRAVTVPFRVDRPFLFFIADCGTGTVIFLGKVTDPR